MKHLRKAEIGQDGERGMASPSNRIRSFKTVAYIANAFTMEEARLRSVTIGRKPEDGLIWVCDIGAKAVMAFSEDGVASLEYLTEIIRQLGCSAGSHMNDFGGFDANDFYSQPARGFCARSVVAIEILKNNKTPEKF